MTKSALTSTGRFCNLRRCTISMLAAGMVTLLMSSDLQAAQIHQYEFTGSYADAFGGPAITPGGPNGLGTLNPTNYSFGANQGLSLGTALPSNATYSLLLDFSFSQLSGFRRIIDFKNQTSDTGLYNLDTALNFFDVATGPAGAFQANVLRRVVITRDSATSQFTGYVNGAQQISFVDTAGLSIFSGPNNIIQFFNDDLVFPGEASAGLVDRIAIYDAALTSLEVVALGGPGTLPGPPVNSVPDGGSTLIMLSGAFGVIGAINRRFHK